MGALNPGEMLAGTTYQVVRQLGQGGMGIVYEIEHVRLKKRYVAKIIHDSISSDEGAVKRMQREAQVLAQMSHPNIVQVHDVGTTPEGLSYFVMEKLEGVDLRFTIKKGGFPRLRSIEIVVDVLEALDYVHKRGIVHRDIKPENIYLSQQHNGVVTKVLDFGIAHIFDSDGQLSQNKITKTGGFVGTLYYAAPEQMQGLHVGPENDVYATGILLFELIAQRGPFDDDPGLGLSRCFKPAPRLADVVPRTPPQLNDAVARALAQDPAMRPTAGQLAAELRQVVAMLKSAPNAFEEERLGLSVGDLLNNMNPPPSPHVATPMAVAAAAVPPSAPAGTTPGVYSTLGQNTPTASTAPKIALVALTVLAMIALLSLGGAVGYRRYAAKKAMATTAAAAVSAAPPAAAVSTVPSAVEAPPSASIVAEPAPTPTAAPTPMQAPAAAAPIPAPRPQQPRPAAPPPPKPSASADHGYMRNL